MAETMEQYMSKTHNEYRSGVARPMIDANAQFELKGQFLKELHKNPFCGLEHEDANEHIKKVLEIVDSFHIPNITQDQLMLRAFPVSLTGAMSKVLQERGFGSLPSSTKTNTRDQVKLISNATTDLSEIRRMEFDPYVEARGVKILEAYDHTLPQKEKDPGSFTLPCFINNVCFNKALVDLGAGVSVMVFSTYTKLGLGILSHTRLTIELADRTIKEPRGIAENVLVRIGKFVFPIDFIILDIPDDDDVPLILRRPFLSTAHAKIDVFKRKVTLRVREEKLVFKSIKLAASIIKRVLVLKSIDSKIELVGEDESLDPLYGNYIELNDLDVPLKPMMSQDNVPTFVNKPTSEYCYEMKFSYVIGYKHINATLFPTLSINLMTKRFYDSRIKDEGDHKGKRIAGTLIAIPIFVGQFSVVLGFTIIDNLDADNDVVLGKPYFKKYMTCQKVMEKSLIEMSTSELWMNEGGKRLAEDVREVDRYGKANLANRNRKPMEFQVGDMVMLKVSPWKGVIRFGKRGKLNPRYIRLFKVLTKVGTIAYRLELPDQLSQVHSTFHVSNLKKCYADEPLAISLDEIQIDDKLNFIEEPVKIMDREVKKLKQSRILIVKVRWSSRRGPEFTWKREDQMNKMYPHFFAKSKPTSESTS
ncbi:ribonuclease H-like domain-containing protein [Tanacetum coccineum]|uniref:Ribonuclease H-like domain-containing protein n=1 Tax=Tanacetum coccineum TaxID=301880 RepID=A0ABQ5F1A1_9ASTR